MTQALTSHSFDSSSPVPQSLPRESLAVSKILSGKIVAYVEEFGAARLILAQPHLDQAMLPQGVRLSKRKPLGQSVRRRGQSKIIVRWPEDEMEALRFPCFLFVYAGEADIPLGDAVLHCPAGYGVLIPPGVPLTEGRGAHWLRPQPEKAHSDIFWIQIRPFGAECHVCHTRGTRHESGGFGQHYVINSRRLFPFAESLIEEMERRSPRFEAVAGAYLFALLNLLLRDWASESSATESTVSTGDGLGRKDVTDPEVAIQRAQAYIENHLGHHLTLQEIAHAAYISRARLAKIFRDKLGQTVWGYVTARRLQDAQSMLLETDLPIQEIARLTGFTRPSHFHARFTELTGMTPGQYRRQRVK